MAEGKASANWSNARLLYPAVDYSRDMWLQMYEQRPDMLTQMLGDLYRVYKSEEEKRLGISNPQGGRRKSHINGNLDELWAIITPRYSMDKFPVAVKELAGKRSLRAFEMKAGLSAGRLNNLIAGRRPLDRYQLEALAKAGDVHPAFFLEWRTMIVQDMVEQVFMSSPNLSIAVLKQMKAS